MDDANETLNFYRRIPPFTDRTGMSDARRFVPAHGDWSVVVTDIVNSTDAIEAGKYKDVNVVGVLTITALLNAAGEIDIPFVFGGDGATLLIPNALRGKAADALVATRNLARAEFGLDLRIGIVPVSDLYARGERLRVARLEVSPNYQQALFLGGGLARAEQLVKDPLTAARYTVRAARGADVPKADYTGFTCRWKSIPSPHAESVSLIVHARGASEAEDETIYRSLLEEIDAVYGDLEQRNPLTAHGLRPAVRDSDLDAEAKVFTPGNDDAKRRRYRWQMRGQIAVTNVWMAVGARISAAQTRRHFPLADSEMPEMDWGKYKKYLIETADVQKMDGALRMVISGYPDQRARLAEFLEAGYRFGRLSYGIHAASSALMTCVVFQPNGRQVHFVDGSDGVYALAAREMKARLHALNLP